MSYILEYNDEINTGEVLVPDIVRVQYDRLAEAAECPEKYHLDLDEASRHIEFVERFCRQSQGEMGKPLKLELFQKAMLEATFGFVDDDGIRQFREVNFFVGRKNGKALSLDTEIPTPDGWKEMKNIRPGSLVFGTDGKPHRVLAESEVFYRPMYAVEFEDGSIIKATGDHLWSVYTKMVQKRLAYARKNGRVRADDSDVKPIAPNKTVVFTTEEMYNKSVCYHRKDGKGVDYRYRVPMPEAIEYPERELPLDPYTLGVWLGDGTKNSPAITCGDEDLDEMVSLLTEAGHRCTVMHYKGRAARINLDIGAKGKKNPFTMALREIGVWNNKHIPEIYLRSSIEQRAALLQGLMDTDGHCEKRGQCEFVQKDIRIVEEFRELLASLGIKNRARRKTVKCNGKECIAYSVFFYTDRSRPCFRLKRKAERLKDHLAPRMEWKSIVDIQPIKKEPSKCIMIDSTDHLYLAGRSYTATHNSTLLAAVALDLLCNDREGAPEIYTIATKLDQAKRCFDEAERMRKQSPMLCRHLRKRASDIYFPANEGIIKPLASDVKKLDSYNSSGVIIDELGAITNRRIYDDMKQSMTSRRQPLLFCISTNNFVRGGIYDAQVEYGNGVLNGTVQDDHFLFIHYKLEERDQWTDRKYWIMANPGLGTIKSEESLAQLVDKARQDPAFRPTVLVKDFNLTELASTKWLEYDDILNKTKIDMEYLTNSYAIGGCDLSSTTDLTCATVIVRKPDDVNLYVLQHYFLPEARVAEIDKQIVPEAPYRKWAEDGWLTICEGTAVDYHQVTEWFLHVVENHDIRPLWVGYDRALAGYWKEEMKSEGFDMEKIAQGAFTWTYPMKQLAAEFRAHRVVYDYNPMLLWCLSNTAVKSRNQEGIESIMPVKAQSNRRIDGTVSLLNAYTCLKNHEEEYEGYIK